LSADGALFVQIGGYHLFLLPTGSLSPLPWGRTGDETWASFPERVYHDCRLPTRAPAEIRRRVAPSRRPGTINTQILEPPGVLRRGRPAAGARGTQIGELELVADGGAERHPVHEADLEQGLLVGRYDRCELGAGDATLSRVHLLLVRDDDAIWAVDTASTNGTTLAGVPIRKARLDDGGELVLGKTVTLRWHRSG
jgi:hypothetical protein